MKASMFVVATLLALTACSSDDDAPEPGQRNAPCIDGTRCSGTFQCVDGTCREACGASYYSATACGGGEFCAPSGGGASSGYCVLSECNGTADCDGGKVCAKLKNGASACLDACNATFVAGSYSDDCPGEAFCQAVGQDAERRLVCLPSKANGQAIGTFCNAVDQPCATNQAYTNDQGDVVTFGLTCVNSQCIELCAPSANAASVDSDCGASVGRGATYCCSQTGADGLTWGICIPFSGSSTCDPYLY